jgi:hypothetical protein
MQTHENIDVSSITKEYGHFITVNLTDQVKNLSSKANDLPYPLLPLIKIIGERQTICLINLDGLPGPTRYYRMKYSKEQKIWIIETYIKTANTREVLRQWTQHFQQPAPPQTVINIWNKFKETGSINDRVRKPRIKTVLTSSNIDRIRYKFVNEPKSSICNAASQLGISYTTIFRGLHQLGMYPYKSVHVHQLLSGDEQMRLQFCRNFQMMYNKMR